jgi:hypothetical protein
LVVPSFLSQLYPHYIQTYCNTTNTGTKKGRRVPELSAGMAYAWVWAMGENMSESMNMGAGMGRSEVCVWEGEG